MSHSTDQSDDNAIDQPTEFVRLFGSPSYNQVLDILPTENDRRQFFKFRDDHEELDLAREAETMKIQADARQFIAEYLGKISGAESAKIGQMISDCHGAADREVAKIVANESWTVLEIIDKKKVVVTKTLQRYREIFALATLRWEDRQRFDEKLVDFEQTLTSLKSRTAAKIREAMATRFRGTNIIPIKYEHGHLEFFVIRGTNHSKVTIRYS